MKPRDSGSRDPAAIELSDELVHAARQAAAGAGRSVADQIEFWARLGQVGEAVMDPAAAAKLLRAHDLPTRRRRPRSVPAGRPRSKGERRSK